MSLSQNTKIGGLVLLALLLSGCGSLFGPSKPTAKTKWQTEAASTQSFDAEGRLAVKVDEKGYYANFVWQNQPQLEVMSIKTPLGNTVGELCRDSLGVIAASNQETPEAEDAEALSQSLLGFGLPLNHLHFWAQAQVVPDVPFQIQSGGELKQEGWVVNRKASAENPAVPVLIELFNPKLNVRLFFDDFTFLETAVTPTESFCQARTQAL